MKKLFLLFVLCLNVLVVSADEYTDPVTKVIYKYRAGTGVARVKEGVSRELESFDDYPDVKSGNPGVKGDIVILDKFAVDGQEYVVNKIGSCAFAFCDITSVALPQTVKEIGELAFYKCDHLTTLNFSTGLEIIYPEAFMSCNGLTTVSLPDGLKIIGRDAFAQCGGLQSIISLVEEPFRIYGICGNPAVKLYVPAGTKEKYLANGWDEFKTIIELETTAVGAAVTENNTGIFMMYDLQGRRLADKPRKGVYIQGGRKYVR